MTASALASPVERARALSPLVRKCADEAEATREIPRALFEQLADADLFHLLLPRTIGGTELDLPTYIQVIEEIGYADASIAWCINQGAVFATHSCAMIPRAGRDIWMDPPRSVVANTAVPIARAIPVEGGYRVTGENMPFSTGCRHASWSAPRGMIYDDGVPRTLPNGLRDIRYFLTPISNVTIHDTWDTRGLRATGTHHFSLKDVFVPEERTVAPSAGPLPGHGPLYRFPRMLQFASGDGAVALGVARACLEAFDALAGAKVADRDRGALREQPLVQTTVGHAIADYHAARALLTHTIERLWRDVSAAGAISLEQRAELRIATTHTIRLCARVVDALYNMAGASAIFASHPIQRHFQDIHVITQHLQGRLAHYDLVGQHRLGLDIDLTML
jgi:alkylation response protein AidB-like acyl-CoA dehydrogenase